MPPSWPYTQHTLYTTEKVGRCSRISELPHVLATTRNVSSYFSHFNLLVQFTSAYEKVPDCRPAMCDALTVKTIPYSKYVEYQRYVRPEVHAWDTMKLKTDRCHLYPQRVHSLRKRVVLSVLNFKKVSAGS